MLDQGADNFSEKDGASITPARAKFETSAGVASALIPCAIKVGSHRFAFAAQFIPMPEGRTSAGADGAFPLSGSVRANVFTDHHGA